MDVQHHNLCNPMTSMLHEPLGKLDGNKVVGDLHIKQENVEDSTDYAAYQGLAIKQENVNIKDEYFVSSATGGISMLHEPLGKLNEDKVVGALHVKQENVEDITNNSADHELAIKQGHVNIKDKFLVSCGVSGSLSEEPFGSMVCEYGAEGNSNFPENVKTDMMQFHLCSVCQYKTISKYNLVNHMVMHTGEKRLKKPYSCSICQYKAALKDDLAKHMRTHTGEKPYSCYICEYKAARKDNLACHVKTHTGEKPYSCSICEYKSAKRVCLVTHMRIHTGEKPYLCSMCKYKAAHKSSLVNHMKTHTGEKPYSCSICKYKATHKHRLVAHVRTHTGEKPYSCPKCEYKAAEQSNLAKHMKMHTW